MIKDQVLLDENIENLNINCYSCKLPANHLFEHCPFLHYVPNKDATLKRHLYSTMNQRVKFPRKTLEISKGGCLRHLSSLENIHKKMKFERKSLFLHYLQLPSRKNIEDDTSLSDEINIFFDKTNNEIENSGNSIENAASFLNIVEEEKEHFKEFEPPSYKDVTTVEKTLSSFNEKMNMSIPHEKKLKSMKRDDFLESKWFSTINHRRSLMNLKKEGKYDYKMQNLFDLEFEKVQPYDVYFPSQNFSNSLKTFLKFTKSKAKKLIK